MTNVVSLHDQLMTISRERYSLTYIIGPHNHWIGGTEYNYNFTILNWPSFQMAHSWLQLEMYRNKISMAHLLHDICQIQILHFYLDIVNPGQIWGMFVQVHYALY